MPSPVFNITTANRSVTQNAGTPLTLTQAFAPNNTAGRALLVLYAYDAGNISIIHTPSISDTAGNTYTRLFTFEHGVNTGPGFTCWLCSSAIGGPNTVTCSSATDWIGFGTFSDTWDTYLILAEFPAGLSFVSIADRQKDGPVSNTLATTLQGGSTVSLTYVFTGFSAYCSFTLFDLWDGASDYLYTAAIVSAPSGTPGTDAATSSPAGYGTLSLLALTTIPESGGASQYLALYQCGPGSRPRPQGLHLT
jgi:hypothetical protein